MGKFKEFLLSENIGLGNLGTKISTFVDSPWLQQQINGAFVPDEHTANRQSNFFDPLYLPKTELTVPKSEKSGRITCLLLKKNPIYVRLSDGTEAHFTFDEWKKIKGEPAVGKNMRIVFQRHPQDWSKQASKIEQVIVTD